MKRKGTQRLCLLGQGYKTLAVYITPVRFLLFILTTITLSYVNLRREEKRIEHFLELLYVYMKAFLRVS
jgi:hypothetical protein